MGGSGVGTGTPGPGEAVLGSSISEICPLMHRGKRPLVPEPLFGERKIAGYPAMDFSDPDRCLTGQVHGDAGSGGHIAANTARRTALSVGL